MKVGLTDNPLGFLLINRRPLYRYLISKYTHFLKRGPFPGMVFLSLNNYGRGTTRITKNIDYYYTNLLLINHFLCLRDSRDSGRQPQGPGIYLHTRTIQRNSMGYFLVSDHHENRAGGAILSDRSLRVAHERTIFYLGSAEGFLFNYIVGGTINKYLWTSALHGGSAGGQVDVSFVSGSVWLHHRITRAHQMTVVQPLKKIRATQQYYLQREYGEYSSAAVSSGNGGGPGIMSWGSGQVLYGTTVEHLREEITEIKNLIHETRKQVQDNVVSKEKMTQVVSKTIEGSVDINLIADQVYSEIARRIKLERERRGLYAG